jgi:omega-amidase
MNDLRITLIQTALHWENKEKNLEMFSQKINAIAEPTDLIVLPEMFSTGFSMKPQQFAEPINGKTATWMLEMAKKKKCVITGSFIGEENGNYYNRLLWANPDGTYRVYDKRHLFRMANEDSHYSSGQKKIIVELKGWKICPLICYDLRFPVWSRNKRVSPKNAANSNIAEAPLNYEYDVLLYVANWPEIRSYPWKALLPARAIENQCYVVGLNRVGNDGNNMMHSGDSVVINARGIIISKTEAYQEITETVNLNYAELEAFRKAFPAMLDADDFTIA